jgi:hypothetical protein
MCRKIVYLMAFVMLLGAVGSVSADSLVAHWEFTEGSGTVIHDSTANHNDGTLYNMEPGDWGQQICPELSASLSFDGVNEYARVPDSASMHFGTNPFTIAFFMKFNGTHGGEILINGTSGPAPKSGKRYEVALSSGSIQFVIDDNVDKIQIGAAYPADKGWHHVVCRRISLAPEPGQGQDIWIDGVRKGAGGGHTPALDIDSPGEDLYMATCIDGAITWFPGELRDVRLYDYAISEEDIAALVYTSLVSWCPTPADEVSNIAIDTDLSWNVPSDANMNADGWTYKVYISTDSTFALTAPVTVGPFSLARATADIGNLSIGTYYWRVDSVEPNTPPVTRTGDVWSFNASATLPELIAPAEGSSNEINVNLAWSSDDSGVVAGSRVYIKEAAGSWVNLGIQTSPFNPYTYGLTDSPDLLTMKWNTGYTWKVEELDSGNNVIAAGPDWHFSVRALACELAADINGNDCFVNLADFATMASEWLDCNWDDGGMASPCP